MSHDDDHSRPAGIGLAFAGIGVSIFAIVDNRRKRTQREKAVIAAHATFEHVHELLIALNQWLQQSASPRSTTVCQLLAKTAKS